MSNLRNHYRFKLDFRKVDQHTAGKWLIHGTKPHKDNQLQRMFNPVFKENVQGGNTQGVAHLQNQNYLGTESLNV